MLKYQVQVFIKHYIVVEKQNKCISFNSKTNGTYALMEIKSHSIIEPHHDETNKITVRPAKTQISLGIRPV